MPDLVPDARVKSLLAKPELNKTERLLLLLALDCETPKKSAAVRSLGVRLGMTEIQGWAIDPLLRATKKKVAKVKNGWILTTQGKHHISKSYGSDGSSSPATATASELRKLLPKLKDSLDRGFVEEAIRCLEVTPPLLRAAVVLSWVGAVAILHEHVINEKLQVFNAEAIKRDTKWKPAKTPDDLGLMKEDTFLDILQTISVVGKNVKQELKNCLTLRNSCGHPNTLAFGENRVASHVEILMLNVFAKFNADGTKA